MIVVTPTSGWLSSTMKKCSSAFTVASPYVGAYLSDAVAGLAQTVSVTLLTRTLIADFATKASDLEAVYRIAKRDGSVLSLSSLHAKVYIVDSIKALVTSANATASGMCRNRECGFEITDRSIVTDLTNSLLAGFGAPTKPSRWTADDLLGLREPVEALRAALPQSVRPLVVPSESPSPIRLAHRQYSRFLNSLPGWTQLTLQGISKIGSETFSMEDVWDACYPLVLARFPDNRFPRQKLRQQMQRLRDMGLVVFLGRGTYKILTTLR